MRSDIAKVICERPRRGADPTKIRTERRRLNRIDGETDVKQASMSRRRRFGWSSKEFSDFLEPLKGFLSKSVGRPWHKVHAEMAALLPKDTTTARHVWTHVDGYVEEHPVFEGGRVYRAQGNAGYRVYDGKVKKEPPSLSELPRDALFVSEHGLLLRYRKKPEKRADTRPTACQLVNPREGYVKQGDAWYHVTFEIVQPGTFGAAFYPSADACGVYHGSHSFETYGRVKGDLPMLAGSTTQALWYRRAISKRLMSKREVKRLVIKP